jgi:surface antigen
VKDGDTVDSIAAKYNTTAQSITSFNDLELSGLVNGKKIVLPGGVLPTNERPGYQAPQARVFTSTAVYSNNSYRYAGGFAGGGVYNVHRNTKQTSPGNTNAWGNCTWYAWERRLEMGRPLPSGALGNAAQWNSSLGAMGYRVDSVPEVGAIFQNGGGYGHVGIVEAINSDGSIEVSEMNNYSGGGYNGINGRTIPAGQVGTFNYIH